MKKLFTFLAGAALLGSLSACSSDEPAKGPDNSGMGEGTNMYLSVSISDVNSISRAGEEESDGTIATETEGDLIPGDENTINDAHFYYFAANGTYMAEATVWSSSEEGSSTEHPNVELESNTLLVLRNIQQDNLPKYLLTVLNAPSDFTDKVTEGKYANLSEMKDELLGIYKASGNTTHFVMTTSSFFGETEYPNDYDDARYNVNVIKDGQLIEEIPTDMSTIGADKIINIYVERLAAKFTLDLPNGNEFEVPTTIGGLTNAGDQTTSGHTKIYVSIDKFDVTNVEEKSYLSKNITGYKENAPWASTEKAGNWNDPKNHRSYWGKSVNYNNADGLTGPTYNQVNGTIGIGAKAVYANETTKSLANLKLPETTSNLNYQQTPNFVVIATVYGKDENGNKIDLNLVQEGSLYYTEEQYIAFTLNRLNADKKLNYYIYTGSETDEDKNKIEYYHQITTDHVKIGRYANDNSRIELKVNADKLPSETTLYAKGADDKFVAISDGMTALGNSLNTLFTDDNYPTGFTTGKMQYFIPVEHLLGNDVSNTGRIVTKEGEYGVVRNHWYKLEITNIKSLGRGLFDPENGTQILRPDKENPTSYAMSARIKILSWKLVKQSVVL